MDTKLKLLLRKQKYQLIGNQVATKLCTWARKAVNGEGSCYKQQFYGIQSHRCIQMTPCVDACTHRCLFCWRPVQFTEQKVDEPDAPEFVFDRLIMAQRVMFAGYKPTAENKKKWAEAQDPRHIAISLAGEPTLYPQLGEFISLAKKRNMTTFLVTNGTRPKVLENLDPLPTQLYVTLPAPDHETYIRTCSPLTDGWKNIIKTLELLPSLDTRTVIRLTLVKGLNMKDPGNFVKLISKAEPWFVEPKAYMHTGFSRYRLQGDSMPEMSEIWQFSGKLAEGLGYQIGDKNISSRVCLLARDTSILNRRFIS